MLVSVNLVTVVSFFKSGFGGPLYVAKLEEHTHFRSCAQRTLDYIRFVGVTTIKQSTLKPVRQVFIHQTAGTLRRIQHCNGTEDLKTDVQRFLRQLPKSMLFMELEKLKNHCEEVVRQSEVYITI